MTNTKTTTKQRQHEAALAAFISAKAEIDRMIDELRSLSDDHFSVSPDEVHWGHVGTVRSLQYDLKQITDCALQRGEYAPEPDGYAYNSHGRRVRVSVP